MNNTRNEIKAHIVRAGFTMQEVSSGRVSAIGRSSSWPMCWAMTLYGRNGENADG